MVRIKNQKLKTLLLLVTLSMSVTGYAEEHPMPHTLSIPDIGRDGVVQEIRRARALFYFSPRVGRPSEVTIEDTKKELPAEGDSNATLFSVEDASIAVDWFNYDEQIVFLEWKAKPDSGGSDSCNFISSDEVIEIEIKFDKESSRFRYNGYGSPGGLEESSDIPSIAPCDAGFRRVSNGINLSGPGDDEGRLPVSIIFVLDKSGSMGNEIPRESENGTGENESKWSALETSVRLFMDMWRTADEVDGSDYDSVGLVFFDDEAEWGFDGDVLPSRVDDGWLEGETSDNSPTDIVSDRISEKTPGGSTSIGAGLQKAESVWPDGRVAFPTFILVSDGRQNTGPMIEYDTSDGSAGDDMGDGPTPALLLNRSGPTIDDSRRLVDWERTILTVTLGAPEGDHAELVSDIAAQTAGTNSTVYSADGMNSTFARSLVEALKGNTLSKLFDHEARELTVLEEAKAHNFTVDKSVKRVTLVVDWNKDPNREVNLHVEAPEVGEVKPDKFVRRDGYIVASYDPPAEVGSGNWEASVYKEVLLIRNPRRDTGREQGFIKAGFTPVQHTPAPNNPRTEAAGSEVEVDYTLDGYALEGDEGLDFRFEAESLQLAACEPLTLRTNLSYGGEPVEGLERGALRVALQRPRKNLGNLLAASNVGGDPQPGARGENSRPSESDEDPQSPLAAKMDAMARAGGLINNIRPRSTDQEYVMTETAPGVYTASIDHTGVGGHYAFTLTMDWEHPDTGRVRRTETYERQLIVLPDPDKTEVDVDRESIVSTTATVSVTPGDDCDNKVGPGYDDRFDVEVSGDGTAGEPTDDGLKGTYEYSLSQLQPGVDPDVTINYRGVTLRDAPLSQLEGTDPPDRCSLPGICCRFTKSEGAGLAAGVAFIGFAGFGVRRQRRKSRIK